MNKLGLKVWPEHIIYLSLLQEEAEESLEQYLETFQELPTAFIACNDVIAIAAVGMLQRAGYKVRRISPLSALTTRAYVR